jgi:hypothetical protein
MRSPVQPVKYVCAELAAQLSRLAARKTMTTMTTVW